MDLKDKIREARKLKKLSQEDLASFLKVTRSSLIRWEQGADIPTSKLLQISETTGQPISFFLSPQRNSNASINSAKQLGAVIDQKDRYIEKLEHELSKRGTSKEAKKTLFEKKLRQEFGVFLRESRLKANLSQRDVAEAAGYENSQYISNIERGLCSIPPVILASMCKLYRISPKKMAKMYNQIHLKVLEYDIKKNS